MKDPLKYFMPEQATPWAADVDFLNSFITYIAAGCTIGITAVMLFFAYKYRRRAQNQQTAFITHNVLLETLWTAIPTLVVIYVFWYGFVVYREMRTPPANAIEIGVTGNQAWQWEFRYANGKLAKDLIVPVNEPVRLIMKSVTTDVGDPATGREGIPPVNHSLFIPSMRVKEDVIGSEFHHMWFNPTKIGEYPIFCAEYCGAGHYNMRSTLRVVTRAEYEDFLRDRGAVELTPDQLGAKLYSEKCIACHSIDGSKVVGPTFKGLWGSKREFADGTSATADENYIAESVLTPSVKVVKDYPPVMPPHPLNNDEITGIIAWLKTLQ